MEVGTTPPSCPLPSGPLNELFKGRRSEMEQKALREEMRHRLHPITCRICRQELAYFRDVGRFPLEEDEVQGAYLQGRGYRFLLTVWWGRVSDHLPMDLKEMPAVSSYYRHMSFHLGVRTEREGTPGAPEDGYLSRSGGFSSDPESSHRAPPSPELPAPASAVTPEALAAPTAFHVVIPVPVPEAAEGGSWSPARVELPQSGRSVMRMAKTMVELNELSVGRSPSGSHRTPSRGRSANNGEPGWLGRAAGSSSGSGGYAIQMPPRPGPEPKRRKPSTRPA